MLPTVVHERMPNYEKQFFYELGGWSEKSVSKIIVIKEMVQLIKDNHFQFTQLILQRAGREVNCKVF